MLHIPNSAGENCSNEKENHSLCLKSDIKSINLRITKIKWWETVPPWPPCFYSFLKTLKPLVLGFWRNAHYQYTNPISRPLMIALQVVKTPFGFHLREWMGNSFPWFEPRSHFISTFSCWVWSSRWTLSGIGLLLLSDWRFDNLFSSQQPTNIRAPHKPITCTLRQLLTNVKDKDKPEGRQEEVYIRSNAATARLLALMKPEETYIKQATDWTQTSDEKW